MKQFVSEKKLPAAHVSKSFLRRLEQLLAMELSALADSSIKVTRYIEISDAFGREQLESVSDYSGDRFSDSTSKIVLHASFGEGDNCSIDVAFATNRDETRFQVRVTGQDAKNQSIRISRAIRALVNEQPALGQYAGAPVGLGFFGILLGVSMGLNSLSYEAAGETAFGVGASVGLLLWLAQYLWPYSEFDTPRLDLLRHVRKIILWLIATIVGAWLVYKIQPLF